MDNNKIMFKKVKERKLDDSEDIVFLGDVRYNPRSPIVIGNESLSGSKYQYDISIFNRMLGRNIIRYHRK